ncbi:AraC family transcriptional regulator [Flavobacterium caeni]|uniref:AraC-type DNA-binding protein n=1 Tax=Flavobacterium caeni TaxID=490189 RepID=A0A1G5I750_9FLAO|nr:AraC family transcriptional regulator [Flavobacterium caeni]SCY71942.1 AraC-type DNA-binding protein [Flavobacterium caeni]
MVYPIYEVQRFKCQSIHDDLYVNTFQEHLKSHAFVEEPHRHNSHLLLFFTQGSGTHTVDFDTYTIAPGSLFALQPGQLHHWDLSTDIDGFVVIYSTEEYNLYFGRKQLSDYPFYASAHQKPEVVLDQLEMQSVLPYFETLIREGQSELRLRRDQMFNLIDCIHIFIARKYAENEAHGTHRYNTKIGVFETLLETHFHDEKSPSFYAERLHITLKHLNRICREMLGKTATEVIAGRVLLEIKRLLADRKLSVNKIADTLGFEDYSYFSRFFKKQTGQSPSDFRKKPTQ